MLLPIVIVYVSRLDWIGNTKIIFVPFIMLRFHIILSSETFSYSIKIEKKIMKNYDSKENEIQICELVTTDQYAERILNKIAK